MRPLLHDLDAERFQARRRSFIPPVGWAAVAAGVAIALFVFRLSTGGTVSAAELLDKASVNEVPPARVQVKTSKRRFVRARHELGDKELAALFRKANFDWNDPLRAGAFAEWRNGLGEKKDDVRILQNPSPRSGRFYRITTSTPEGVLSEVSIMIRAADLRAVEERFAFRKSEWSDDEWVEISEPPAEGPAQPSIASDHPEPAPVSEAPERASATDEIRVLEALHRIGADLGEPVEVRRGEQSIDVTVLGATSRREKEIREAVGGLPHVELRFEQPQAVRGAGPDVTHSSIDAPSGPLQSRLLALMGSATNVENWTNAALEASEQIVARAHAIRQIQERFGDATVLTPADRDAVHKIASDHHQALRSSLRRLGDTLQPLTGPVDAPVSANRPDARALLASAQRLDTVLTVALASPNASEDPEATIQRLRQSLAELERAASEFAP